MKQIGRLTITIGFYGEDEAFVRIVPQGKDIIEIFEEGGQAWTNIKGAVHALIAEMGQPAQGREVSIRSESL